MADIHSPQRRHANMAAIHVKDTKPEMVVRRLLWGAWIPLQAELSTTVGQS